MNKDVTDYIDNIDQNWKIDIAKKLRKLVHDNVSGVDEQIKWKMPHFMLNGKYLCVIAPAKNWVAFQIFSATPLDVPEGMFEGMPERRTIKIKDGQQVDYNLLAKLLKQAAGSIK